jgi:hypothetical protein
MTFSADYFSARERFRRAAARLGWVIETHPISARGPAGQPLSVDIARAGDDQATDTLVVSSGLHGVEGFFGSAIQCALLEQWPLHRPLPPGVRVVLLHALNPFGFCWLRRFDEQNVDPNRNFLCGADAYRGSHPAYTELEGWLNPRRRPSGWELPPLKALWAALRLPVPTLRAALAGGQYDYPHGLFYGGARPSTARRLLEAHLERWIGGSSRVLHLDLHTGLGRWATFKLLADDPLGEARTAWLGRCFGPGALEDSDAPGVAYAARGSLGSWCAARFPAVDYTYLCAEFGTYRPLEVLAGLRAENQAHHWGRPGSLRTRRAKGRLRELFCPTSPGWRRQVLRQGLTLLQTARRTLSTVETRSSHADRDYPPPGSRTGKV